MKEEFTIGQIVFYTRILPKVGIYDLLFENDVKMYGTQTVFV